MLNFLTKQYWRNPFKLKFVHDGLGDLVRVIKLHGTICVSLPALGCCEKIGESWCLRDHFPVRFVRYPHD
jgi:hypothetical protein